MSGRQHSHRPLRRWQHKSDNGGERSSGAGPAEPNGGERSSGAGPTEFNGGERSAGAGQESLTEVSILQEVAGWLVVSRTR